MAIDVFFSYAHEDEDLMNDVRRQLVIYEREGQIRKWYDRMIPAGDEWESQIDRRIRQAQIILLFVSPSFIESKYCYDIEVTEALKRHESNKAYVIPIILRPCAWEEAPFSKLQALPRDGIAVSQWADRDQVCLDIARAVIEVARKMSETSVNEAHQHFGSNSSQEAVKSVRSEKPYRILIAGSSRYYGSDQTEDLFRQTCREVGRQLAVRRLHLVIGSYASDTADIAVAETFLQYGGYQVTIAGIAEMSELWWNNKLGSDLDLSFTQVSGSWEHNGRSEQIRMSDAVFIIGGAKGAIDLSKRCVDEHHPIVATPQLGQAAKSIWDKRVRPQALSASSDCVRLLESGTPSEVAVAGLDLLSLIIR